MPGRSNLEMSQHQVTPWIDTPISRTYSGLMHTNAGDGTASINLLRKLIAFPTVSRDSNLELIHFVRDLLAEQGAVVRLTYDDEKRKANLFATLGPSDEPGIVLSGHTDVVPVDG